MLDLITCEQFEPHLNKHFVIHVSPGQTVDMVLIEVKRFPVQPGRAAKREPFSLLFRGPREFYLPQRIYDVSEESLGKVGVFLVPIGPDEIGHRYEAIFN